MVESLSNIIFSRFLLSYPTFHSIMMFSCPVSLFTRLIPHIFLSCHSCVQFIVLLTSPRKKKKKKENLSVITMPYIFVFVPKFFIFLSFTMMLYFRLLLSRWDNIFLFPPQVTIFFRFTLAS